MWLVQFIVTCSIFICFVLTQETENDVAPMDLENVILELFENCKCVRYTQCNLDGFVVTDGEGFINARADVDNSTRPKCNGGDFDGQYICCRLTNGTEDTTVTVSETVPIFTTTIGEKEKKVCGLQKTNLNDRILIEGDESALIDGEFPWIAAIYKKEANGEYQFYCSGSLINPKVILTSSHYFYRKSADQFRVILNGKIELATIGNKPEEERDISDIVNHPRFRSGSLYNDAALLILNEPFGIKLENIINRICLPPDLEVNLEGARCSVAGWGQEPKEQRLDTQSQVLEMKEVDVPFVNFESCQNLLRNTRLGPRFRLDKSFMCAGGEEGKDACKGDGGSPLMCPRPEADGYYIAGIVSWGIGCGALNVPGVYTDVYKIKGWILKELLERKIPFQLD